MPKSLRHLVYRGRGRSPNSGKPISHSPQPLITEAKKSYWDLAATKLQNEEPKISEALSDLLRDQEPNPMNIVTQLEFIVQKHKQTMEERQWTLPFRVRGREIKIRSQLDTVLKILQTSKDIGSAIASLDPIHAGLPWSGISFIVQGILNDSE